MKKHLPPFLLASLLVFFIPTGAGTLSAALIDPLDNTINFTSGFGGATAVANGDGTVSLLRTISGVDSGIDWRPSGTGFLSLATESLLSISPTASGNGGYWASSILFFDSSFSFLSENTWLSDTNSLAVQTLDVGQFRVDAGVSSSAEYYFVRHRVQPFTFSGGSPSFTFTEMSATAVPEPSVLALLTGFTALALSLRKRRSLFQTAA